MPEDKKTGASVSLTKGSHGGSYVVQDMKDSDKKQENIVLINPEQGKKLGDKDSWYTPDFMKVVFKK
jgi:hypothetical protein